MTVEVHVFGAPETAAAVLRLLDELGISATLAARSALTSSQDARCVLVLADDYPSGRPTVLSDAESEWLRRQVQSGGQAYVEFATDASGLLPLPTGPVRRATIERIFTPAALGDFEPLDLFDEHSSWMIPVDRMGAELLTYGVVAGVHTAVFGPPQSSDPALLDIPVGAGRLLYASTALSNFERGRYRLASRWRRLLRWLLISLVDRDIPPVDLEVRTDPPVWAPSGTPVCVLVSTQAMVSVLGSALTLHRTDAGYVSEPVTLPDGDHVIEVSAATSRASAAISVGPRADRYRRMIDRGIAWYDAAGMFFGASDGSRGVAEGFYGSIGPDGRHPLNETSRGDCYTETAYAFQLYAELSGEPRYQLIADNLVSTVRREGQLLDPNPLYGAWEPRGIRRSLTDTNNLFADDNGWISLLMLAEREEESIRSGLRGTESLIRTAHAELGLQTNPWRPPAYVMSAGWNRMAHKEFRDNLDVSSHWQSMPQVALLYAYAVTGERRYLDVALRSIDHMVAAFPHTRIETSRTTEVVRFLLPLAGAYRYTHDDRYLATMRSIGEFLSSKLDPSTGALVEWDGRNPESNEEYGVDECSIVQSNGDPVTDQLYTTGFAAMYLPIAFQATGDEVFRDLASGVLDYLTRIQIDCGSADLDGTWMRSFDFEHWEYYGSNADIGWGPYCVETGWCTAPILIGAMLYLSDRAFFPDRVTDRHALAAQVTAEFSGIETMEAAASTAVAVAAEVPVGRCGDGTVWCERNGVRSTLGRRAGHPVAVDNPAAQAIEVYARDDDGSAYHCYLDARSGIGDWVSLGPVDGDVDACFNPAAGAVEVYAVGIGGVLQHCTLIDVRHGHSAWEPVGSLAMTGRPSVVYNAGTSLVEVWCRGQDGVIYRTVKENRAHRPWSPVVDEHIGGDPVTVYDAAGGVVRGYAVDGAGTPYEIGARSLGNVVLAGRPAPVFNPARDVVEIYARGTDGRLYQSLAHGSWSIRGPELVSSDPVAIFDPVARCVRVHADAVDEQ